MKAKMSKAPLNREISGHGKRGPVVKPPRQPLIADAKGNGKKSTFGAPRKGDDMNPMACGYMKMKG